MDQQIIQGETQYETQSVGTSLAGKPFVLVYEHKTRDMTIVFY